MAEGTEERNKEQSGRPGGNYNNNRRRHHGHRHSNNPNRFNNAPRQEGDGAPQNRNPEGGQQRPGNGSHPQNYSRRDNFGGGQRDYGRRHEHIKAHETLEDIQKDILRIEKEIEMEISEISAAKLGV